jgi:dTDP-4-dehydrorhamnose reductase
MMPPTFTGEELARLLGRPAHPGLTAAQRRAFRGSRVLITGAGGSIGSELAREVAGCGPAALGLLDQSELGLFAVEREIAGRWPDVPVTACLADITRRAAVLRACRDVRPDVIYHAAAYKHVTMAERAVAVAAHVNVLGTVEMAAAAEAVGARFVLISSDKAADPESVMGATKRLAELATLSLASATFRPVVVRFGNVLGSSGSVVPIFHQIFADIGDEQSLEQSLSTFSSHVSRIAHILKTADAKSLVLLDELGAGTASETVLAAPLLGRVPPGCLLLWDRHFFSFDHLWRVRACGSHVLGRLSKSVKPKLLRRLADGSYLAEIRSGHRSQFGRRGRLFLRLLPYRLADPSRGDPEQEHRLFTTLLGVGVHPATGLIVLYHERWEQELTNDEVKTHQLRRPVLRSHTPEGVEQEVAALLVAHHAVRRVMVEAAHQAGVPPRRISFVGALDVIQCRLPGMSAARRQPVRLRRWYEALVAEVSREVLPPRQPRNNPRVVKCARVKWPGKKTVKQKPPQPDKPFGEVVTLIELTI